MTIRALLVIVSLWIVGGCVPHSDEPAPAPTAAPAASAMPTPENPPLPASPNPAGMPTPSTPTDPGAAGPPPTLPLPSLPAAPAGAFVPPSAPAVPTERVAAEAGVGVRGQSLQNESGLLVEPAKAYFRVEQRVVFEMEIPKALQLHKALEGRAPQSHDEFMNKIIAANQIKLPTLPAGNKYVYDPQREELMVEKPAAK